MLEYYVEQVHTGEPVHAWRDPESLTSLDLERNSA
jgi:hypothetical protein